ncbi:Imm39 family immunity protein [Candidatus Odyssella thessalonicensis]|uniref:Imm39 family immunity protein n=1 Tax=Candidatus Odyssella thessalonicensis TaxID=84647 RepID=UPI000225AF9F|nr:Imm39 family immunity protein [Candidatus Odyssella thessalonicensis]
MIQSVIPPSGISIGGAVAMVVGRFVRKGPQRITELKPIFHYMYDNRYFKDQKFAVIYLFYRYGIKTELIPQYDRIHSKYKDLTIYVELDTLILDWADKNNPELLKEIYLIAACEAVLHVLRKYKLPTEPVEKIRSKLGEIPLTIEDCEIWEQKIPLTPEAILGYTPAPWP